MLFEYNAATSVPYAYAYVFVRVVEIPPFMSGIAFLHTLRRIIASNLSLFAGVAAFLMPLSAVCADDSRDEKFFQLLQSISEVVPGILGYSRWPNTSSESLKRLCVIGPTDYTYLLLSTELTVPGWESNVRRLSVAHRNIVDDCQALYIGNLPDIEQANLFSLISSQPVLSISEQNDSCIVTTLFCLRINESSVGFEINLDSVERSGIRINPNVLRLGSRSR